MTERAKIICAAQGEELDEMEGYEEEREEEEKVEEGNESWNIRGILKWKQGKSEWKEKFLTKEILKLTQEKKIDITKYSTFQTIEVDLCIYQYHLSCRPYVYLSK